MAKSILNAVPSVNAGHYRLSEEDRQTILAQNPFGQATIKVTSAAPVAIPGHYFLPEQDRQTIFAQARFIETTMLIESQRQAFMAKNGGSAFGLITNKRARMMPTPPLTHPSGTQYTPFMCQIDFKRFVNLRR